MKDHYFIHPQTEKQVALSSRTRKGIHRCWTSWWAAFQWEGRSTKVQPIWDIVPGVFKESTSWVYNRKIIIPFEIIPQKTDSTSRAESPTGCRRSIMSYKRDSEKPGTRERNAAELSSIVTCCFKISPQSQLKIDPCDARREGEGRKGGITLPPASFECKHKQATGSVKQ